MKHCKKFEELISAYLDGELDSSDKLFLEEHLRSCPSCVNLLALYHGSSVSMRESCVEAPTSLRDSVMKEIKLSDTERIITPSYTDEIDEEFEAQMKKRKLRHTILTRYAPIAASVAIALLVLPQFFNINRSQNEATPVTARVTAPDAPAAIPEMVYDDIEEAMPFGVDDLEIAEDLEIVVAEESFDDDALARQADSEDYTIGIPAPAERGGEEQPHISTPTGDIDINWSFINGWTMNDSLLEEENVASAGYYAFIMIAHEFTDTFPLTPFLSDYYWMEQSDVAMFVEQYRASIVHHIPGDETAEFALIQFVR